MDITHSSPPAWSQLLDQAIDRRFPAMVELRRHLHQHPELSGHEQQTSLHLYQKLGDDGFDVRLGPEGRGVIADSVDAARSTSGWLALRADIDALRIHDRKETAYRSQRPGVMHACGHDGHTALVWGAITALSDLRREGALPWETPVRGIFQPAEETCAGAREMIHVGALQGVRAIMAVHMDPGRQVGRIGLRPGVLTANCDEMKISIVGRGGHAARPHEASDPITAAAQLIQALYMHIPRSTDSQDAVVVTIGEIRGGDNANVIPEEVTLRGTIRTLDRTVRAQTREHICRLGAGIGQTCDVKVSVDFGLGSGSVNNDPQLIHLFRRASEDRLGAEAIDNIPRASMGSEDFAFYLDHVPGAMLRLGCASETVGRSALHTPTFDIDEEALRIGAGVLARSAIYWAQSQLA
ncbi:putative hydrolase YxeP [Lignipirellula cremea]|uniref:Putative hydrolase YxeP n=2 Tax=Lignipirellula cremea TaxID=2528010 RepID=A0A518E3H2_9BACT|nr:putative hydrolase YxeP [Lignipirellula cremea]